MIKNINPHKPTNDEKSDIDSKIKENTLKKDDISISML